MGIFNLDEDEENLTIDNPKAFGERWELEASKKASDKLERFLNSRGQEALDWFDAVFNKGVKPKEYMQAYADVQDFSTADLTQEAAQERIVREFLKDQDFEAELARVRNMGDLEETSKRYQKALVKRQAAKLQKMKADSEAKEQQKATDRENYRVALTQHL